MARAPRRGLWPGVFLACLLVAGARSIAIGKDANWDLLNYHWYNAWALVNGRLGWDLAPAQLQTYHNPLGDLPFFALVNALPWPRHVAFWMAATAAAAAFFLLRTLVLLFPAGRPRGAPAWLAASAAMGLTGAAGLATLGSTMNEWPSAALTLAALWLAIRARIEGTARHPRGFAAAAFLVGCAVGLKLTYGVFALAFLAALGSWGSLRERARRVAIAGLLALAGFAALYGWWGGVLWREFGNPFFPYYNGIFRSPWWEPANFFDRNFGPRDLSQWLFFPFHFARRSTLVAEVGFRDYRLAVLMALAFLAALKAGVRALRRRAQPAPGAAPDPVDGAWLFLAVFAAIAYLAWLKLFGIYRYLVPLELVSGALIVACLLYLVRGPAARYAVVAVLAALVVGTTRPGSWGRIEFGRAYFEVSAPPLPAGSLVVMGYSHPMAYVIPFFRADARFVSPANNFILPGQDHRLAARIEETIRGHDGPLFLLEYKVREKRDEQTLAYFGLAIDDAACRPVRSPMSWDYIRICGLRRVKPQMNTDEHR